MHIRTVDNTDELTNHILRFFNTDDENGFLITDLQDSEYIQQLNNTMGEDEAYYVIRNTTYSLVNLGLLEKTNFVSRRGTRYRTTDRGKEFLGLIRVA